MATRWRPRPRRDRPHAAGALVTGGQGHVEVVREVDRERADDAEEGAAGRERRAAERQHREGRLRAVRRDLADLAREREADVLVVVRVDGDAGRRLEERGIEERDGLDRERLDLAEQTRGAVTRVRRRGDGEGGGGRGHERQAGDGAGPRP